jgi:hypothetical protein
MSFEEAMDCLFNGEPREDGTRWGVQPVKRSGWSITWWVEADDGELVLHLPGVGFVPYRPARDDKEATDWHILIVQRIKVRP